MILLPVDILLGPCSGHCPAGKAGWAWSTGYIDLTFSKLNWTGEVGENFPAGNETWGGLRRWARPVRWPAAHASTRTLSSTCNGWWENTNPRPCPARLYSSLHEIHNGKFSSYSGQLLDLLENVQRREAGFLTLTTLVQIEIDWNSCMPDQPDHSGWTWLPSIQHFDIFLVSSSIFLSPFISIFPSFISSFVRLSFPILPLLLC